MAIRKILAPLDGSAESKPGLLTAFAAGRDLKAHVGVLHVRADARDSLPLLGDSIPGTVVEEMIEAAARDAKKRALHARAMFDAECTQYAIAEAEGPDDRDSMTASWREEVGSEDGTVARLGRLADLIVAGRPSPDAGVSITLTLHAALFETGRPVLVAPPEAPLVFGRKAAILWNGSAQAARAVASALPFFSEVGEVTVLSAETERTPASRALELADYLAWHGIEAKTRAVPVEGRVVGEVLLQECAAIGADLLVTGAYTHSRMRQLILGGVTSHVLENAKIPMLMAH